MWIADNEPANRYHRPAISAPAFIKARNGVTMEPVSLVIYRAVLWLYQLPDKRLPDENRNQIVIRRYYPRYKPVFDLH